MLVLQGHTNSVQALAYRPGGETLISAGDDCTIRLWNLRTGQPLTALRGHEDAILTLAISPDGSWLASGGHDKKVRLWNLRREILAETFEPFQRSVNAVAFGSDGRFLACGAELYIAEPTLRFIDLDSLMVYRPPSVARLPAGVWSLGLAPDGTFAVGWSTGRVELISVPDGQPFTVLPHRLAVTVLAFSPDSTILATLSANTVFVWDVQKTELRRTLGTHGGRTTSVAFTPDGRSIATGGWDSTVRIWDVDSGHEKKRFDWELGRRINAVAIAPDGMTAAAAGDAHDIIIWDIDDL